jgi:hypothetical protein
MMNKRDLYDKKDWGKGPWLRECDLAFWIDDVTSYPCVARRSYFGAWMGHVGIDSGHPLYMLNTDSPEFEFIDTHGSPNIIVAFNEKDAHLFFPPQKLWWVGFSCMCKGDYVPWVDKEETGAPPKPKTKGRVGIKDYRKFDYVVEHIQTLATQLASFDSRITVGDMDER